MNESRAGDQHDDDLQWMQDIEKYRALLLEEMKLLRTACGWPSRTLIAEETAAGGAGLSLHTIGNIFSQRDTMSSWTSYRQVIEVLGGDLRYFYPLYLRASGLVGAKDQYDRFQRIAQDGLPTLADPDAAPFVIPGSDGDAASSVLTFVDEPPPLGDKHRLPHEMWALQLRTQPGRWATSPMLSNPTMVNGITKGTYRAYRPAGSFEAMWRKGRLYVRYVGVDRKHQ